MSFQDKFLNIFNNTINKINEHKPIIYIISFIFYFLLYFLIKIPQQVKNSNKNPIINVINNINQKLWFMIILLILNILYIIFIIVSFNFYYKYINYIIVGSIFISFIIIYIDIISYNKYFTIISNSIITKIIYLILSTLFYIIFIILFFKNIDSVFDDDYKLNIEFIISLEILLLFLIEYIINSINSLNEIYYKLKNDDFSTLTVQCFNNTINEQYNNNTTVNTQINNISDKYGTNYLKTIGNIPIAFLNSNNDDYQDLILADFYYPGSYYTYLADTPLNGSPNLDAIRIALVDFKVRIIHLDIFSDLDDLYDPKSLPIVKCENMKEGQSGLNFNDVLGTINKWAWITDDPNKLCYPLFIYLNFKFPEENENIYLRIYESLIKYFSKYFVDKKYSFSGRNNAFPISMAKMKDCLGKIIIITNNYPTKTVLDELINTSINDLNHYITLNEYKQSYITYDKLGLSLDNNKIDLLNNSKSCLTLYYTNPNISYKNNNQSKAGLFNPSFQDCAQYGIQSTLMYLFVPDDNLNKWNLFFKNKNNLDPVLKDELLRLVNKKQLEIKSQPPITGLQTPQKYCIVNGLISTNKSNISENLTNSSCQ